MKRSASLQMKHPTSNRLMSERFARNASSPFYSRGRLEIHLSQVSFGRFPRLCVISLTMNTIDLFTTPHENMALLPKDYKIFENRKLRSSFKSFCGIFCEITHVKPIDVIFNFVQMPTSKQEIKTIEVNKVVSVEVYLSRWTTPVIGQGPVSGTSRKRFGP